MRVLRALAGGTELEPVTAVERPVGVFRFVMIDGYHRYFAACVLGVKILPAKQGWLHEQWSAPK